MVACLIALSISSWPGYGQRQPVAKPSWQYKLVFIPEKDFGKTEEILNGHGAEGWEMVQIDAAGRSGSLYYMKRIK